MTLRSKKPSNYLKNLLYDSQLETKKVTKKPNKKIITEKNNKSNSQVRSRSASRNKENKNSMNLMMKSKQLTPVKTQDVDKSVKIGNKLDMSASLIGKVIDDDICASDFNILKNIPSQCCKKEIKKITDKIKNIEKDYKNLYSMVRVISEQNAKKKQPTKKRKKLEITDDDKKALILKIDNELTKEQKLNMREIIKDYIKLLPCGGYNLQVDSLPDYKFLEIKKYVDGCFSENFKNKSLRQSVNFVEDSKILNVRISIYIESQSEYETYHESEKIRRR